MPTRALQPDLSAEVAAHAASQHDDDARRASLQFRVAQSVRSAGVIFIALLAVVYVLYDRVPRRNLLLWAGLILGVTLWRAMQATVFRKRVAGASLAQLRRQEWLVLANATTYALAMGSAFWLIALPGDLYVRMLVTLLSMLFMVGGLMNATSDQWPRYMLGGGNVGQGILFWMGLGTGGEPRWEILLAYSGLIFLAFTFIRERLRQFRESLAIRAENAALLLQAQADRQITEAALRDAKLANDSKSRFLAAASHDLRQPLHALTMFLGTMTFHVTTDDAKRLLSRIKETAHVLEEQFNSLLDLSRFDAGVVAVDIKPFRLDSHVERLIEQIRPLAEAKNLQITATASPAIARSDPLLIARVLRNLLDNAIKYTEAGSVRVRVTEQQDSFLVEVEDTGAGIAAEQQARIFDEYVQLTNPGRQRQRGVGLGLAIVKRIDSLLGLRLTLRSAPGAGSHFSFYVPAATDIARTRDAQGHQALPSAATFNTSASIWVLDDNRIALDGLHAQLSAWGASVIAFTRPEDLLAQLRAGVALPHWILTDDMLGASLSGLETAQILSQQFGFGKVCLVTGNTEPGRLAELRSSGFPVIVKPARPEELIAVIGT
jgi:signal transduction histidine kinase/CheY-like chemotaxis protein